MSKMLWLEQFRNLSTAQTWQDIASDTMICLYETYKFRLNDLEDSSKLRGLIYTMLRNRYLQLIQQQKRREELTFEGFGQIEDYYFSKSEHTQQKNFVFLINKYLQKLRVWDEKRWVIFQIWLRLHYPLPNDDFQKKLGDVEQFKICSSTETELIAELIRQFITNSPESLGISAKTLTALRGENKLNTIKSDVRRAKYFLRGCDFQLSDSKNPIEINRHKFISCVK
ncbi:MAG: hypothetical protein R3C26_12300 [Calditrichia bacterium]